LKVIISVLNINIHIYHNTDLHKYSGESLKLHCEVKSSEMPRQKWEKTDGTFPSIFRKEEKGM
jgi:hypothetical protein